MVLFWWPLLVSTEAGGGLELVLVWWPLPECSWRLERRLVDSVLVAIAGVHGDWRGLELVLVWWPLPKCPRRLEGASSWCWFDGHCRSVHGD